MIRLYVLVIFFFSLLACQDAATPESVAAKNTDDYAYKMMVLTNPDFNDRGIVKKRYRFLIPKFVSSCEDILHNDKAADMVYFVFKKLMNMGITKPEDLLNHTESLHRAVQETLPLFGYEETIEKCAEVFVLFLNARTNGLSAHEARERTVQTYRSILRP